MASRLDLEARLRALREPRAPAAAASHEPLAPQTMAPAVPMAPVVPVAVAAPPVSSPQLHKPRPKRASVSRPRPNFASFSSPAPTGLSAPASEPTRPPTVLAPPPPPVDITQLLGPAYEQAVAQAQFAIECERRRLVNTAIDSYILSGQALVALGRQQTEPHLQIILRTKALALLQRAEGLEEWASRIIAENNAKLRDGAFANSAAVAPNNEETLRAAFAQHEAQEEQALNEKEALVAKMKSHNNEMVQKLNQLAVLMKVRTRFRRVISERRARKAEEQRLRGENPQGEEDGEMDVDRERSKSQAEDEYHEEDDAAREVVTPRAAKSLPTSLSSSPREEQKRLLLNELHQRIGLPQVDHLRTFKPLAETADRDQRRDNLERELEEARLEAERLRIAVQEMEDTLRAAAEHSRERSLKLEKEKEEEVAQLQAQLQRMKSELDLERRSSGKRSSVYLDSDDDDDDDDDDSRVRHPESYEDNDIMTKLRLSLNGLNQEDMLSPRSLAECRSSSGAANRRASQVARNSEEHSSPRHRNQRMGSWGFDRDDEEDDGMWV